MKPKPVTHCQPYLTQAQTRRLVKLLELHPRKGDAWLGAIHTLTTMERR